VPKYVRNFAEAQFLDNMKAQKKKKLNKKNKTKNHIHQFKFFY